MYAMDGFGGDQQQTSPGHSNGFEQQRLSPHESQGFTSHAQQNFGSDEYLSQQPVYDDSMEGGGESGDLQTYAPDAYGYGPTSSYTDGYQDGGGYSGEVDTNGYAYENGVDPTIYQQDAAVGDDGSGSLSTEHLALPLPAAHLNLHHNHALSNTVNSGVGPSYIPHQSFDAHGGHYRVASVSTRLSAAYAWALEGFSQAEDEKLVSLPFGPPNWRWQLVVYPKGAGDGDGSHLSAFIRPLKNDLELALGDAWQRPITKFLIRVRRAVPGSPVIGLADPAENFLASDTSQPSFTGFSAAMTGWGFPELLNLSMVPEAVSYDGTLNLDAEVIGEQFVDWGVYRHQWDIPSFLQLTEDETVSQPFGPPDYLWRIQIFRQGNKDGHGTHFSAYLIPEPSERERALGSAWTRPIVSLTIKAQINPSGEMLMSKTLTGGFSFTHETSECGWAQMVELSHLNSAMDWYATLSIVTEVTWDLSYDTAGTDLGKVKDSLTMASIELEAAKDRLNALSQELDNSRSEVVELRAELALFQGKYAGLQHDNAQNIEQLETVQSRLRTLGNIEARMAVVQKELLSAQKRVEQAEIIEDRFAMMREELAAAREAQDHADSLKWKLADVKARMSALRAGMEEGASLSASELPEGEEASPEAIKQDLLHATSRVLELERDLTEVRAERDAKSRALTDASLFAPVPEDFSKPQSTDGDESIIAGIETIRSEILVVRGVLLEIEDRDVDTPASRAALSAELAMAQAELEVARATFISLISQVPDELSEDSELSIEVDVVSQELQSARADVSTKRASLEDPSDEIANLSEDRGTSPIRQSFPQGMQIPHASASDFGVTRVAARDGIDAVPLPAGVMPPPTDLDNASHPVASHGTNHQLLQAEERFAAADRELASVRYERDGIRAELDETRDRLQAARNMLVHSSTGTVDAQGMMENLFGRRLSQAPVPLDLTEPVELWTPVEGHAAGVDSKALKARLSGLQSSNRRGLIPTLFAIITSLVTLWFVLYSTIYVVCSPAHLATHQDAVYHKPCTTAVLPAWSAVMHTWHGAAEGFVVDVAPTVGRNFKQAVRQGRVALRGVRRKILAAPTLAPREVEVPVAENYADHAATEAIDQPYRPDQHSADTVVESSFEQTETLVETHSQQAQSQTLSPIDNSHQESAQTTAHDEHTPISEAESETTTVVQSHHQYAISNVEHASTTPVSTASPDSAESTILSDSPTFLPSLQDQSEASSSTSSVTAAHTAPPEPEIADLAFQPITDEEIQQLIPEVLSDVFASNASSLGVPPTSAPDMETVDNASIENVDQSPPIVSSEAEVPVPTSTQSPAEPLSTELAEEETKSDVVPTVVVVEAAPGSTPHIEPDGVQDTEPIGSHTSSHDTSSTDTVLIPPVEAEPATESLTIPSLSVLADASSPTITVPAPLSAEPPHQKDEL
ncbi:hypothetical protein HKX48_003348 [Thoreauomyces humboldtii]|nr:hypothetical protein HKX48_003348 [Thoreauomyces humboldtii]